MSLFIWRRERDITLFRHCGVLGVNPCARPRSAEPFVRFAHSNRVRTPQQIEKTYLATGLFYLAEREGFEPSLELAPH